MQVDKRSGVVIGSYSRGLLSLAVKVRGGYKSVGGRAG